MYVGKIIELQLIFCICFIRYLHILTRMQAISNELYLNKTGMSFALILNLTLTSKEQWERNTKKEEN